MPNAQSNFLLGHDLLNEQEIKLLATQCPGQPPLAAAVSQGVLPAVIAQDCERLLASSMPDGLKPHLPGLLLLAEVGKGSRGTVYRAWQQSLRRVVAVKVLPRQFLDDKEALARFKREARIGARLAHPTLVRAFDVGSASGHVYIVLEYVEGETLRQRLKQQETLDLRSALTIISHVADGLAFAASKGITHRDIKPANIQLTAGEGVKILDLGLARPEGESTLTQPLVVHGTPAYLAPEQAKGEASLSPKVDVYALGVLTFRCLTGKHLFEAQDTSDMLSKHIHERPRALKSLVKDLPPGMSDLVASMLDKKPTARPDAASVAVKFRLYLQNLTGQARAINARSDSTRTQTSKPARQPIPWLGILIATTATALGVVLFFLLTGVDNARLQRELNLREREDEATKLQKHAEQRVKAATEYEKALNKLVDAAAREADADAQPADDVNEAFSRAARENDDLLDD